MTEAAAESVSREIYEAFRRMREKDFTGAEALLQAGLAKAEDLKNPTQSALYLSTLGVLEKTKGDLKAAWRYYERAEKLLPQDPSLKIIMAKILIDKFAQYDNAVKKLKTVLKIAKGAASFEHQAHAALAIAYLKKGDKKKAVEMFDLAMTDDFVNVTSAENLNFEVVEAFLSRNIEAERCRAYVQKSLALARARRETKSIAFLTKLFESFETTLH